MNKVTRKIRAEMGQNYGTVFKTLEQEMQFIKIRILSQRATLVHNDLYLCCIMAKSINKTCTKNALK